jgi:myo-inositol-1(or 4)-monophosphatase
MHAECPADLARLIDAVRRVAHTEIMPRYLQVTHDHKGDGSWLTAADVAAQLALSRELAEIADAPLLGEEMSAAEQQDAWDRGTHGVWCVDPIDGTTNFVFGLPFFAVSVAFMREGRSEYGVVYDPVADEMFYAARDAGAWLNGKRLPIRLPPPDLADATANIDLKRLPRALGLALASRPPYGSQRNLGASSLEWCYTAAGRFSVYVHGGQKLWDYAAGALILQEAGGRCATLEQDDFWTCRLWERSAIAATTPELFEPWASWIESVVGPVSDRLA